MKVVFLLCLLGLAVNAYPGKLVSSDEDSDDRSIFPQFPSLHRRISDSFSPDVVRIDVGGQDDDHDDDDDDDEGYFRAFFRPLFVNPFSGFRFPSFMTPSFSSDGPGSVGSLGAPKNATSTTNVINGHKVIKNDTTYEKDGAVYRFQVIQISPVDEDNGSEADVAPATDTVSSSSTTKSDSNSYDNEINREEVSGPNESNTDDLKA